MKHWLHPARFLYTVAFTTLFIIFGFYAPKVWLTYFDKTDYYSVEQPVPVDKEVYKPCENIIATIVRTSFIVDSAHSTVQVYLINGSTLNKYSPLFDDNIIIEKSNARIFHLTYKLPCDLKNGKYFIQALITYHINGIPKTYIWATNAFTINNTEEDQL